MRCPFKNKMKQRLLTSLLVFGLVSTAFAADDNVGSESQQSESNINFRFLDKNKRGATKITNADSPTFNHLPASNTATTSTSSYQLPATGVKSTTANQPFRYVYNQQYYQPNPYLTYVQIPQAAQIAAQYAFQANPVAHFLQTPTQIQYVATPTIAQAPQIKYQSFSTANPTAESTSSATAPQYVTQAQQQVASSSSSATTQSKQVQVPVYSDYQTAQPVYYTQQPVFTYIPQAQAANYIYQQPNVNYLLKQQQQQQISNIYGAHRFGFYTPQQNAQLTYLVPMVLSQSQQDSSTLTSSTKSSDKTASNTQQHSSGNSFSFGTKS